jgi:hypothetical protein
MVRPEGFEPPTQGLELPGSLQAELRALDLRLFALFSLLFIILPSRP